jgi:hypothetical protein
MMMLINEASANNEGVSGEKRFITGVPTTLEIVMS